MHKNKAKRFDLIQHIKRYFSITPYQDIISWCQQNIDFSDQISAQRNKLDFDLYPYQVPILKQWQMKSDVIKTIVVVAPEQIGKTNLFVDGILYNMVFSPCQSLIVYPDDDLAVTTNQTKLKPLMKHIPVLKEQLDKPKSCKADCYKFSNLISYFQGAGAKIVSRSCKIVVGDQIDDWRPPPNVNAISDLKKRTRSYNSSICFLISTPTFEDGNIWQAFLDGSRGYWYLRCKGCGQLTMRSCDIYNLQFQSELKQESGVRQVKPQTIRLICPKCKHQHVETDKRWMNINGGFIHQIPQRLRTDPSFQIGGLASQLPSMSWQRIANKQLKSSSRNKLKDQIDFDNSTKGLPYKERKIEKEQLEKIRDHEWRPNEAPKQEQIEAIFITADTQDDRSVVGVWAMDIFDNLFLIKASEPTYLMLRQDQRQKINAVRKEQASLKNIPYTPIQTVEDIFNAEYLVQNGVGITPSLIFIDRRGHRAKEVDKFILQHKDARAWLGSKLQAEWRPSKDIYKGVLVNALNYQKEAIYYLHTQKKRGGEYMFLYPGIEERILNQMAACQPDPDVNFGHLPQNWTFGNRQHDWFDVTKMACFARQYLIQNSYSNVFRFCKSPRLKDRFGKKIVKQQKSVQQPKPNKPSWLNGYKL